MPTEFPDDFLFGFSTASYQIEGAVAEDGRGASIWDTFTRLEGTVAHGENGDRACDHYHRYREDLDLLVQAGAGAYRFSIAWPRVLPEGKGEVNPRGLDFYDRLVDELLERQVEPWICLYHWDLPQALQDRGGWPNRDLVHWFTDYALVVADRLGDRAAAVALFNEPSIASILGYLYGRHAPGVTSLERSLATTHHLNLATAQAAAALRAERPDSRLGTILAWNHVEPKSDRNEDVEAAELIDAFWHRAYLDPLLSGRYPEPLTKPLEPYTLDDDGERLRAELDFLGVNYYTRMLAESDPKSPTLGARPAPPDPAAPLTAMGWEVFPRGLTSVLRQLGAREGVPPLYVTENGAAFDDELTEAGRIHDRQRIAYLESHLEACLEAVAAGVDLRGYFVWSLIDNFEWAEGYDKRFGLAHVDYDTLVRTPKDSFAWFAEVARTRRLP